MPRAKSTEANRRPAAEVRFIEPMYSLAIKNLPEGKDWLYEVKFDGYRCLAGKRNDGVTLWSRRGNLFTAQFPHIARACERLPADTLLDGEILAVDESGRISFNLLQHHRSKAQALLFYAFDVLICRGKSLLNLPLEERRKVLGEIFEKVRSKVSLIKLSETIDATPTELVRVAKQLGFEGILAKRRDSYYESGKRSGAWLKYRINRGQELSDRRICFRETPSIPSSSGTIKTAHCCTRARCETALFRTPATTKSPGLPDSRIVPGIVTPATVKLWITPAPLTPLRGGFCSGPSLALPDIRRNPNENSGSLLRFRIPNRTYLGTGVRASLSVSCSDRLCPW